VMFSLIEGDTFWSTKINYRVEGVAMCFGMLEW
jgi:hypothetical protein